MPLRGFRSARKLTGTGLAYPNKNGEASSNKRPGSKIVPVGSMRLASDRTLYGRHHWRHTAINWQRMTRRGGEQPLDDCPVMARERREPQPLILSGCGFGQPNIHFAPTASQGRIVGFSNWGGSVRNGAIGNLLAVLTYLCPRLAA